MKYLLLIYANEEQDASTSPEEQEAGIKAWFDYTDQLQESGDYVAGDGLQPTSTATTVRVRDGKQVTTHGPFAETKEQLGGYYLVDVDNLDEAIEWAARCPGAHYGAIEVRPLLTFD